VPVYKWQLLPDFLVNNGLSPHKVSTSPSVATLGLGFTPLMAQFVPNNIIFNEDCRVFILRYQSTSHLTCPVLFRPGHLLYAVIQSCIRRFIHSCIHYIHTFTHTHHTRNIIHTWLHSSPKVLFGNISFVRSWPKQQVAGSTNEQLAIFIFSKSVIPSVSGQEMSLSFYLHTTINPVSR